MKNKGYDTIWLVGCNPTLEDPILAITLKKEYSDKGIVISNITDPLKVTGKNPLIIIRNINKQNCKRFYSYH